MIHKLLIWVTRPKILQILSRFCEEVNDEKDISPFLDRIMKDLAVPDHDDGPIEFDMRRLEGRRFEFEILSRKT